MTVWYFFMFFILLSNIFLTTSSVQASLDVPCYTPLIIQGINQLVYI